ncbi:MAG: hypothetical protein CM1200mP18_10500 [Gammaproteobacteria bacterium]|nr:MAG: hypothetical protein CM1200mP18_10500 [Gammaproteobacteria bacterium]
MTVGNRKQNCVITLSSLWGAWLAVQYGPDQIICQEFVDYYCLGSSASPERLPLPNPVLYHFVKHILGGTVIPHFNITPGQDQGESQHPYYRHYLDLRYQETPDLDCFLYGRFAGSSENSRSVDDDAGSSGCTSGGELIAGDHLDPWLLKFKINSDFFSQGSPHWFFHCLHHDH